MKVPVVDTQGNKVKDITVNDGVFKVEPNKEAIAQYLRVYLTNQRQGTSSTKTRGEVSGGGRKPWRQKHTGRARHGSTRSPIWVGGGVAHGPRPRNWRLSLPKKVRQLAIRSALSQKFMDKAVVCVDDIKFSSPKTKEVVKTVSPLLADRKNLIVWLAKDENLVRGLANVPNIAVRDVQTLNVYDVLDATKLIIVEDALNYLNNKYKNETK